MTTTSPIESRGSTPRPAARRTPLALVLAALRGDKHMVDAYPPAELPAKEQSVPG
jgi:hypothetical protein